MDILLKQAHRAIMRILAIISCMVIFFLMWIQEAHSESLNQTQSSQIQTEIQNLATPSGRNFRYKLEYYLNHYGEKEVQISLVEAHWLAKDTHLVVLRGRDINSDGLIETWFYNEGAIVKALQRSADSENAWPVAQSILAELSLNESRWISTLAARELLAGLFFTIEGEFQDSKEMEQTQIDLLDLDFKIKEYENNKENLALVPELKRVSYNGWRNLLYRWTHTQIEESHKRMLGDVALFVGASVVLKGVRFLLVKTLSSESITSIKTYMREAVEQQKGWTQKLTARVAKLMPKKKGVIEASLTPLSLESANVGLAIRFDTESAAITWLSRNTLFSRTLTKIGGLFKDAATASWDNRGYIAMAQTIQLAVESYNRGYWKFSETPLVLDHPVKSSREFINQVAHDKGLLQNMSYMTLQTTLLSGVSEALSRNGAGLGLKYAVCSVITLVDSASVNVLIQGNTNYSRVSFDTAWELLIGGSQIHLDLHMLRWANGLAEKFHNPKLKLVGYLLGSLDQTAGYFMYNKTTSALFENPHGPTASNTDAPSELLPVVIVPVLAPQTLP